MNDFWPIIGSVIGVFLVIGIGALCRHLRWLTAEADRTLANLTANVMLPAYFIHKFAESHSLDSLTTAWQPPLVGFGFTVVGFAIAYGFARLFGPRIGLETDASQRAFALCAGICNYGYIPLPLAEQFYPSAMIDLILHNVGVDVALWSVGLAIISGSGAGGWKRVFRSPPLWAVLFSIVLSRLGLTEQIPRPVMAAIGKLGACAIPLGLLLSGAIIVDFLREDNWIAKPRVILAGIGLRQCMFPLLMLAFGRWCITSDNLQTVVALQASMPAAVFPIVLARLYDRDTATALRVVLWTSLAGLLLIPTWLWIATWWLGKS